MFSNMDPVKAAKAMSGVKSPDDIALLLIHMDTKKSAAILDNMKATLATKVMTSIVAMQKAAPVTAVAHSICESGSQPDSNP